MLECRRVLFFSFIFSFFSVLLVIDNLQIVLDSFYISIFTCLHDY